MSDVWMALGICIVVVLSGALPLLRNRGNEAPPPPPRETLRDWRKDGQNGQDSEGSA